MKTILFASTNQGKFSELKAGCQEYGVHLVSPADVVARQSAINPATKAEQRGPPTSIPEVDESEATYEGNALKKARSAAEWARSWNTEIPALADDTGLEVDALGGAPGLFSARYGGPGATADDNRKALKCALAALGPCGSGGKFPARFVCVLALVWPSGQELVVRESLKGFVILEDRGAGGFGYDPMFEVEHTRRTLAQLKGEGVHVDTHRFKALKSLMSLLGQRL